MCTRCTEEWSGRINMYSMYSGKVGKDKYAQHVQRKGGEGRDKYVQYVQRKGEEG